MFQAQIRCRSLVLAAAMACVGAGAAALPVAADQVQLTATLAGANEVPGPGDPHATGTIAITVDTDLAQLCYQLSVSNLSSAATAAHIHQGAAGLAGPVVVPLAAPVDGTSSDCVTTDGQLAADIAANPSAYYANVHTADFPAGAARGQLDFANSHHADDSMPDHSVAEPDHAVQPTDHSAAQPDHTVPPTPTPGAHGDQPAPHSSGH